MTARFSADILSRKAALLEAMRNGSINAIEVTYSGSGDSGQIDDVTVTPNVPSFVRYDGSDVALREFVEEFADQVIEAEHPGYDNNDGGSGVITISRKTGSVDWTHSDYYTESDTSDYAF